MKQTAEANGVRTFGRPSYASRTVLLFRTWSRLRLFVMKHVLVFTKYPVPGFAKTRLIPSLGKLGSASVSRQLSERCMKSVRDFVQAQSDPGIVILHVYFAARDTTTENAMAAWLGCQNGEKYIPQQSEGGLGDRLSAAFADSFRDGADRVVVVGTDIPEVSADVLNTAFQELDSHDVVIGPAQDGGYYLLGMKAPRLQLFSHISWSTDQVMAQTKQRAEEGGLSLAILHTLRDVDTPDDVEYASKFVDIPLREY